jgi:glycosyltransferase involved in cell wall biosynthesis
MKINLSLVIPFYNESNSLKEIYESIKFSISKYNNILKYEIIFVDDGSIDNS